MKKTIFNAGARLYDLFTSQKAWREHCRLLSPTGEQFDSILDVGCGPGVSTFELENLHPEANVIGLDIAEKMIKQAKRRKQLRKSRAGFTIGNAELLPFRNDQFDLVTGHSFLYLLDDGERVLAEIHRVLEPGGRVGFLEPRATPGLGWFLPCLMQGPRFFCTMVGWQISSGLAGRFDRDQIQDLLDRTGYSDIDISVTLDGLGWLIRGTKD